MAALYPFRNSAVHAKEEQIARAVVPDPFEQNAMASRWNAIVRELAMRAIRRYNTV